MNLQIVTVSWNAAYALALMWESAQKLNPGYDLSLAVVDNGSTDGALQYAERHTDLLLKSTNCRSHGVCLTELGRRVETEYFVVCDNDIVFTRSGAIDFMFEHMDEKTWVVCPTRPGAVKGAPIHDGTIGYSPNICVGLFHTETFQKVCRELDLGYAGNFTDGSVWETGGLAWRVARTHGLDSVELPELWQYCGHWGSVSQIWHHIPNYPSLEGLNPTLDEGGKRSYLDRYERIKKSLAEIRGCRIEELDNHEPKSPNPLKPTVETLSWEWIKLYHPFLTPGAGVR